MEKEKPDPKSTHKEEPIEHPEKEPIEVMLSRAHGDMTVAILQIQNAYGLPAYLTDLLLTAILADIRGCANKDLMNVMDQKYR